MFKHRDSDRPIVYSHDSIARAIKAIESFFSDVVIERRYRDGSQLYTVPIRLAHKSNMVEKMLSDLQDDRNISDIMPRMGLSIDYILPSVGEGHGTDRRMPTYKQKGDTRVIMEGGRPIKIGLTLTVVSVHMQELLVIMEMIYAAFNPKLEVPLIETELAHRWQGHVILDGSPTEIAKEWSKDDDRFLEVEFRMHTVINIYPPLRTVRPIKRVTIDFIDQDAPDTILVSSAWQVDPHIAKKTEDHEQYHTIAEEGGEATETERIEVPGVPEN